LNDISFEHPELSDFLTEIVARRFDSKRPVADRTISKYIASDIVGRGAFSIVYKGLHADLNMPVAIKMMKHDMAMNSEFLSHFRAEAKFLAKFNHENIVQVFDIEDRYRTLFIIMEYLTGNTLRSILRSKGRLSEERVVNFIIQICRGLQIAHQHGIVHQDIKPGNIFILPNDKIKILDFGLACPKGTENFLTGTPFYMSPEQVKCLPVDQRSDIYSLGLVVYRMLTGRKPFDGDDHWRVMEMRTQREIADPAALVPDINVSLRELILKACARDPDKRYQDVSEILGAIRSLASELGLVDANNYNAKRKMRMFYLVYDNHDTQKLEDAFKNFNVVMKRIGAEFRAGEIIDI
jgi:serine/threonine protein kinase